MRGRPGRPLGDRPRGRSGGAVSQSTTRNRETAARAARRWMGALATLALVAGCRADRSARRPGADSAATTSAHPATTGATGAAPGVAAAAGNELAYVTNEEGRTLTIIDPAT